jgi:hypothetical protein
VVAERSEGSWRKRGEAVANIRAVVDEWAEAGDR